MAYNQISAAKVAEQTLLDLANEEKRKMDHYEEMNMKFKTLSDHFDQVTKEKEEY